MIFASPIFIFGFLPAFLVLYYLMPRQGRSAFLLAASYVFYGWWRVEYLAVVIGISVIGYVAGSYAVAAKSERARRRAVGTGVILILCCLAYFKYAMFFAQSLDSLSSTLGGPGIPIMQIILPIGISFLAFQSISYIIDVARKDAPPASSMIEFLAFSSLFPQLIAGPVLRYKDVADQFRERAHSLEKFSVGLRRFVTGLAMKLLVADSVAPLADRLYGLTEPSLVEAWLGSLAYAVQLLFDFAGYSAMAIGLGLMIGFRFVENFNAPYTSRSITEFWRRWHISLSSWLRDYLYVPLGGNRHGTLKTYRNLMLTMVLGGFWHGANWTFLLWGAWHGLALSLERVLGARDGKSIWPRGTGWIATMLIVLVGWVMFRAPDVAAALTVYGGMLGLNGVAPSPGFAYATQPIELAALTLGGAVAVFGPKLKGLSTKSLRYGAPASTAALLLLSVMALNARTHSPFLYFQF